MSLKNIEHIVVVMFENRSFDNLLGWLYNDQVAPSYNIPPKSPPTFEGLNHNGYSNLINGKKIFASCPPTGWPPMNNPYSVPSIDPHEEFEHVTFQLFSTSNPNENDIPDMSGFLQNYSSTSAGVQSAEQIM